MKNIDINKIKNTDVFKIPDNYFDTLTDRVMSKIPADESNVVSINSINKKAAAWWKWTSAVAASVAVVITGTLLINTASTTQEIEGTTAATYYDESSQDDIFYSMLDTEDIYCYLSGEEF